MHVLPRDIVIKFISVAGGEVIICFIAKWWSVILVRGATEQSRAKAVQRTGAIRAD